MATPTPLTDCAVTYLLQKIDSLVSREWNLVREINKDVYNLRRELEVVRSILREADTKVNLSNEQVKVWLRQIREVAYDIEDAFDIFNVKIRNSGDSKYTNNWNFNFLKPWIERRSFAMEIEEIQTKLTLLGQLRGKYNDFVRGHHHGSSSSSSQYMTINPKIAFCYPGDVVGIEEPRKHLTDWATTARNLKVKFVVGMGGVGKTVVARTVFGETKQSFDCYAWVTLSRSHTKMEVLRIIKQQFSAESLPESVSLVQLMDDLRSYLMCKDYMVVLDDLWNYELWQSIKHAFPTPSQDRRGRIIITTRRGDLAKRCSGGDSVSIYNHELLPPEKAGKLLRKIAFRDHGGQFPSGSNDLVEWSDKFLKQCEGLPLAIDAIGRLLSNTGTTINAWKKLHDSLGSELHVNDSCGLSDFTQVISPSYEDLPFHLKLCLLYFTSFPEDYKVRRRRLIRLWISEGFVRPVDGKMLEEVGEDWLNELVQRNVVLATDTDLDGRPSTCKLHPLVRKIILNKSKEENFCKVSLKPGHTHDQMETISVRRLSVQNGYYNNLPEMGYSRCRALFILGAMDMQSTSAKQPLERSILLRALDLEGTILNEFPSIILNLVLLQYLNLRDTSIMEIPNSISKLQRLEVLNLKETLVRELPNTITQLAKLQSLLVSKNYCLGTIGRAKGFTPPVRIGKLTSLEKLSLIKASGDGRTLMQELGNLTQLRKLGIVDLKEQDGKLLCESIGRMTDLLSLEVVSFAEASSVTEKAFIPEKHFLDLTAMTQHPKQLQSLLLKGRLNQLPAWVSSLHDLVKMRLKRSKLSTSPIDIIQDLPHLTELQLLDAYAGAQLVFPSRKFPSLRILELGDLSALELLSMQGGEGPCLAFKSYL